jgi:hypothetical protein
VAVVDEPVQEGFGDAAQVEACRLGVFVPATVE